jgi:hypothetical protein
MNKLEIADLLKTEPRQWKISALRGENQSVRWLPIIDVSGKNFYLGLSEEGFWVAWLETVICGLEQGSDYWAALALQWLESRKELQTVELEQVLKKVSKAKWASQKVRQRSKRLKFAISLDKKDKLLPENAKKMPIIDNFPLVQFAISYCNAYSFSSSQDRVINITNP